MSLIRVIQTAFGVKGFGYKPDPADTRDLMLSTRLGAVAPPPSASVRNAKIIVKDQGATSSCTGQGTSQALRMAYLHAGVDCPDLSALFPYHQGRALENAETVDDGAIIRDVIKAVIQWGESDELSWPFKVSNVNKNPSIKAYRSAYDRRGTKKYYRINQGDVNGIRRAIASGYPVVAGWDLSQSFMDSSGKGIIGAQKAPYVGGHCMCIVSYAADGSFDIINSWGAGWGKSGYFTASSAFVTQARDLWAIEVV